MSEHAPQRTAFRSAPVLVTAGLGLLLTGIVWSMAMEYADDHASGLFRRQAQEIGHALQKQLDIHSEVLRGMQGFFNHSGEVTREEFQRYTKQLHLQERYPGVQAFAFARRVRGAERDAFEARLRRELAADFAVHTLANQSYPRQDEYLVLEYVHPFAPNRAWLGLDLLGDPVRRASATRAGDSGQMAVSERLSLPGVDQGSAIFCLSAPVYAQGEVALTPEGRRAALAGTVNLVFRLKDMLSGIISTEQRRQFDLEIYADAAAALAGERRRLIYDTAEGEDEVSPALHAFGTNTHLQVALPLRIGDRDWMLVATALPSFEPTRASRLLPNLVAVSGLVSTLLLSLLVALAVVRRRRIMARLGVSEARLQAMYTGSRDALMLLAPPAWRFIGANPAALDLFGVPNEASFTTLAPWEVSPERQPDGHLSNEKAREMIATALRNGSHNFEWEHQCLDGKPFPADVLLTRIEVGGEVLLQATVRDITARKQAEQGFRATFEQTAVGMAQVDPATGRISRVNKRFADMLGYPAATLVGMTCRELTHPDDHIRDDQQTASLKQGEVTDYSIEKRLRTSAGGILWVSVTASLVCDEAGRPLHGQLVVEDITERKRVEQTLQALNTALTGEVFFEHLARTLTDILEAELAFVSEVSERTPGYARTCALIVDGQRVPDLEYGLAGTPCENVIGKKPCVYPDGVQQLFPADAILAELGVVAYAAAPLWDSQGRPLGNIGIMSRHPITQVQPVENVLRLMALRAGSELERERQEQQLEARVHDRTHALELSIQSLASKEEEIRSLLSHLVDAVIHIDEQGVVRSANPAVERILGWLPEDLVGRNVSLLMPEPHRSAHDGHLKRYLHTGEGLVINRRREVEGLHKDGRQIPLELAVGEYRVHGERFFTGILRDISERQRIMAELEQARNDAEAANRAKSAFLATMSHEIRTPMNGVIGMVELLAQGRLDEHQREMVETVRESSFILLRVIDDILDFSKLEAGKLAIEAAPLCLERLLEGVCDALDTVARDKQVDLYLFVDPAIPDTVWSDAVRLRQILNNLIGNAIKFSARSERRGQVAVRAMVRGREPGQQGERIRVEFSVADDGIGMSVEEQGHLFKPFTQADAATTRRFGGTGLGLSIVHRLVNLMEGDIQVHSAPGEGAIFTVSLPLGLQATERKSEPDEPLLRGLECLVVSQEASRASDLGAYLNAAGARTCLVADPVAALRQMEAPRPDGGLVVIHDSGLEKPPLDELLALGTMLSTPHLLILLTHGQRRRPRQEAPGIVSLDIELLHRGLFIEAVALAAGRLPADKLTSTASPPATSPTPAPGIGRPRATLPILVAEDNETNRKVIQRQLTLLGYTADLAEDGVAAMERWLGGKYALLLTDLHMPRMDGYSLAEVIRREEAGKRHIPIVAFTANIMKEDQERCLRIGMDDFLSKPVQLPQLKVILEKWLGEDGAAAQCLRGEDAAPTPSSAIPVIQIDVLTQLVGDDPAIVAEFLRDFLVSAGRCAEELRAAWEAGDLAEVGAAGHKLKSSSRSVGALALGELCAQIETAGKTGEQQTLARLVPEFEASLAEVIKAIG